jgi:hypothetical protein
MLGSVGHDPSGQLVRDRCVRWPQPRGLLPGEWAQGVHGPAEGGHAPQRGHTRCRVALARGREGVQRERVQGERVQGEAACSSLTASGASAKAPSATYANASCGCKVRARRAAASAASSEAPAFSSCTACITGRLTRSSASTDSAEGLAAQDTKDACTQDGARQKSRERGLDERSNGRVPTERALRRRASTARVVALYTRLARVASEKEATQGKRRRLTVAEYTQAPI